MPRVCHFGRRRARNTRRRRRVAQARQLGFEGGDPGEQRGGVVAVGHRAMIPAIASGG